MKLTSSSNMSGFLAKRAGNLSFDLVLKEEADKAAPVVGRVSIPHTNLKGVYMIDNTPVQVIELTPAHAVVRLNKLEVRLARQKAGHYYGWLQPIEKAEAATDDEFFGKAAETTEAEIPF